MQASEGGIYLHIPFCRKACVYCDFHFITSLKQKSDMVAALLQELSLRKSFFSDDTQLGTVYFGGGTPSVLSPEELSELIQQIQQDFHILPDAEWTLEANPDDEFATEIRSALSSEPVRYATYTREYLGWGVFALMER